MVFGAGILFNLLFLGYFKYCDFFIGSVNFLFKSDYALRGSCFRSALVSSRSSRFLLTEYYWTSCRSAMVSRLCLFHHVRSEVKHGAI